MFKAPEGTKERLRRINPNVSALLREQVECLLRGDRAESALKKVGDLAGSCSGPREASTSRDYLKQYASKGRH